MNLCMSMGSQENKQNKVRTQLWDTLYIIHVLDFKKYFYFLISGKTEKNSYPKERIGGYFQK